MNKIVMWFMVIVGSGFGGWMASDWRGTQLFSVCAFLFLMLGAIISSYLTIRSYGIRAACKTLITLSLFAYSIEAIGVHTGFPYGTFSYLDGLDPLVKGVPLLLPLAWVPLVLATWQIATRLAKDRLTVIGLSAWILLVVDLVLDPGAVFLGLWTYQAGGAYHSVPVTNFLGWILSGSVGTWLTNDFLLKPKGSLFYWCLALISSLGFWSAVSWRAGFMTPLGIGLILLIGTSVLVWRDENTRIC